MPQGIYKHRQNKPKQKNVPGQWCLRKPPETLPFRGRKVDRCKCGKNLGQWMVLWGRQLYFIQPPTQLQKDIWLGEATRKIGEEKALACLRWFCHGCRVVQLP